MLRRRVALVIAPDGSDELVMLRTGPDGPALLFFDVKTGKQLRARSLGNDPGGVKALYMVDRDLVLYCSRSRGGSMWMVVYSRAALAVVAEWSTHLRHSGWPLAVHPLGLRIQCDWTNVPSTLAAYDLMTGKRLDSRVWQHVYDQLGHFGSSFTDPGTGITWFVRGVTKTLVCLYAILP